RKGAGERSRVVSVSGHPRWEPASRHPRQQPGLKGTRYNKQMIIVLKSGASDAQVEDVCHRITAIGYSPHTIRGTLSTVIGAVGHDRGKHAMRSLESLEGVESVTPILKPYKLASREVRDEPTGIRVGDVTIGGKSLVVMAGPCSVESRPQLLEAAEKVKA